MIIKIAREEKIIPKAWGNDKQPQPSSIRVRVPTAAEVEQLLAEKSSDSQLFSRFVVGADGWTDENGKELGPQDLLSAPGSYPLVTEIACKILSLAMLGDEEKNG